MDQTIGKSKTNNNFMLKTVPPNKELFLPALSTAIEIKKNKKKKEKEKRKKERKKCGVTTHFNKVIKYPSIL